MNITFLLGPLNQKIAELKLELTHLEQFRDQLMKSAREPKVPSPEPPPAALAQPAAPPRPKRRSSKSRQSERRRVGCRKDVLLALLSGPGSVTEVNKIVRRTRDEVRYALSRLCKEGCCLLNEHEVYVLTTGGQMQATFFVENPDRVSLSHQDHRALAQRASQLAAQPMSRPS